MLLFTLAPAAMITPPKASPKKNPKQNQEGEPGNLPRRARHLVLSRHVAQNASSAGRQPSRRACDLQASWREDVTGTLSSAPPRWRDAPHARECSSRRAARHNRCTACGCKAARARSSRSPESRAARPTDEDGRLFVFTAIGRQRVLPVLPLRLRTVGHASEPASAQRRWTGRTRRRAVYTRPPNGKDTDL